MGQSQKDAVRPELSSCFSSSFQTGRGHDGSNDFPGGPRDGWGI